VGGNSSGAFLLSGGIFNTIAVPTRKPLKHSGSMTADRWWGIISNFRRRYSTAFC
jgi:hypothetical protein